MACRPSKVARRKTTNVALTRQQPTLLHALVRECRDMSPTPLSHVYRVPSLGPSRCFGVGWLRPEYYVMLCTAVYVMKY